MFEKKLHNHGPGIAGWSVRVWAYGGWLFEVGGENKKGRKAGEV